MSDAASPVEFVEIDDSGLLLRGERDVVLDVTFGGRRIWSFWLQRDSTPGPHGGRQIAWPDSLLKYLDGHARVAIVEHLSGAVIYDADTQFGDATTAIEIVNSQGNPLGIDKSGRMAQTFDTRSAEHVAPLLDSIEEVLQALAGAGVEAFPAYGTLLGAVREGHLIGHDSDADLGYVSRHSHPVDVMRESFRLQRRLTEAGYQITRYSGIAFKVTVTEGDGSLRGLDVFGGFITEGHLYLMGEVGVPFSESWIFPLGTTTLEGRTLPAPALPEKLLEAMYGPGWKVPDPAFHFETPRTTVRRLNGWFRGTRVFRDSWDRYYSTRRKVLPEGAPSPLSAYVAESDPLVRAGSPRIVDLGCGRAGDALWFARQGARVTGFDFVPSASTAAQTAARDEGVDLTVEPLNLNEWRSVLGVGAQLAAVDGPCVVIADHVADALTAGARASLWRVASMALRQGGMLYVSAWLGGGDKRKMQRAVRLGQLAKELEAAGFTVVESERIDAIDDPGRRIGRIVAKWGEN